MLILNRRPGEAILIDGGIRVVVLQSDRRGVRLGIEAPTDTHIRREELVSQVAAENRRARAAQQGVAAWAAKLPLRSEPR
jgi:carbon storage regulator